MLHSQNYLPQTVLIYICSIFLLLLLSNGHLSAQKLDSLKKLLKIPTVDKAEQLDVLFKIASYYQRVDLDSAWHYTTMANKQLTNPTVEQEMKILDLQGRILREKGELEEAEKLLRKGLAIGKTSKDYRQLSNLNANLSECLSQQGRLKEGLKYKLAHLELVTKANVDYFVLVNATADIGNYYYDISDYDLAKEYFIKAYEMADSIVEKGGRQSFEDGAKMVISNYVGIVLMEQKNYQEATQYLEQSVKMAKASEFYVDEATAINNLGLIFLKQNRFKEARSYFQKALNLYEQEQFEIGIAEVLGDLTKLMLAIENYPKVIEYGEKALKIQQEQKDVALQSAANNALYLGYKELGNYQKSLGYLETHQTLQDSIASENKVRELTQMEMNFEFDREKEKLALQQEKQEAILKAETKQTQTVAIGIGILALLSLGFLWNTYRNNQKIKEQNDIISKKNTELEQLNHIKDQLFSIIGHDLRKPALAFQGIAKKINYLVQKQDFGRLSRMSMQIEKAAFSLNGLLDNLLNWALQQRNVVLLQPQQFEIEEVITEIVDLYSQIATEKNVELQVNIPTDITVFSDIHAFSTIVRNLVDNAVKFTPKGGQVKLKAMTTDNQTQLLVEDTGLGIPQDKIRDLFELQKNKSTPDSEGHKSSGLGLNVVKELVKLNKGSIQVSSKLNAGTRFEVLLPT